MLPQGSGSSRSDSSRWAASKRLLVSRLRTQTDCATVVEWIPDSEALYHFTGPRLYWPLTVEQLIEAEQHEASLSAWVVIDPSTDTLVGHFELTCSDSEARLGRLILAPERRGCGLARVLLELALNRGRELGATTVTLNVISDNQPAIRTYERAGFHRLPSSGPPDNIAMTLNLD